MAIAVGITAVGNGSPAQLRVMSGTTKRSQWARKSLSGENHHIYVIRHRYQPTCISMKCFLLMHMRVED